MTLLEYVALIALVAGFLSLVIRGVVARSRMAEAAAGIAGIERSL